jgi:capsular polysaccharide export protein
MNIAYLDPPYSRYFQALSSHLARRTGGSAVALLSCPAYRMYTRGDRSIVWKPGSTEQRYAVPPSFERAEWADAGSEPFIQAFSHAVSWFKERFQTERIDTCLMFSDARPFSVAAQLAAQELGVVCVYFERGAFRLRTSSLSTQGINARFDLTTAEGWEHISGMNEADLPARRATEPWLRLRFAKFLAAHALSRAIEPVRGLMQHKSYHVFNYVRIALKQFGVEHPELPMPHEPEPPQGSAPLVLLPLQLPTDSQFVMYSPFRHNQELIDFVVSGVRKALPGAEVLVKMHPMDVRRYRLPEGARLIDGNLARFYPRTALVVCLNSNVGFEAAIRGKQVLCFGDSFYTGPGRCCVVRVSRENFIEHAKAAVARGDTPATGNELKAAVLRYYQAPGDAWAYSDEDIERTAGIVVQHVNAERPAQSGRPAAPAAALAASLQSPQDAETVSPPIRPSKLVTSSGTGR